METAPARPSSPQWRRPLSAAAKPPTHDERGNGLPPLVLADSNKIKSEGVVQDFKIHSASTSMSSTATPGLSSPRTIYSGPPPPYSYPSSTAGAPANNSGYASPPDSRRMSDDDKETALRSLPSIHEALGKDHGSLYSAAPLAPPTTHTAVPPALSPTTPVPRSHPEPTLAGPPNPYANSQPLPPYSNESGERRHSHPRQGSQSEEFGYGNRQPSGNENGVYAAHQNSTSSPVPPMRPSPRMSSSTHPSSSIYQSSPQPHPPPPGHRPPGPAYSFPPPAPSSFATYQAPYSVPPYWRPDGAEVDRAEEMRKTAPKQVTGGGQGYGESVKRHLDIFELETSLNEIAEGCGRGLEFSRHFGSRAHQSQRTGMDTAAMPTIAQCDEMIQRQTNVLQSMSRIREIIIAQQTALAEQRSREEANKPHHPGFGHDPNMYPKDGDGSAGYAGADSKRRRGRNAPPGKCHSCARVETPEWRRGPDGARTLCNACGLHYAKLNRKMGTKAAVGNSSLRPKENGSS